MEESNMETRLAKKKKLLLLQSESQTQTTDPFDRLQDEIIHHILNFLPIEDVARTSLVSKRWRSLWQSLPDLDFATLKREATLKLKAASDAEYPKFLSFANRRHSADVKNVNDFIFLNDKTKDFISRVLTLRYQQKKFFNLRTLKVRALMGSTSLNHLIRCAMQLNIRELYLEVATKDHFNLPKRVLSSPSLEVFQFKSVFPGFRLPPISLIRSGGFRSLKNLSLSNLLLYKEPQFVDMFNGSSFPFLKELRLSCCEGLKHLTVRCPVLELLAIEDCAQISRLEIYGTEFQRLYVSSCFLSVTRVSIKIIAPGLRLLEWKDKEVVEISLVHELTGLEECCVQIALKLLILNDIRAPNVTKLLSAIRYTRSLTLSSDSMKVLHKLTQRRDSVLESFVNLRCLKVASYFDTLPALAYLFRICPKLHTLVILMSTYEKFDPWRISASEMDDFWESQGEDLEPFLDNLKVVKIDGFSEDEYDEVFLVKFLLRHAKNLEEMTISRGYVSKKFYTKEFLLRDETRSEIKRLAQDVSNARLIY